MCLKILCLIYMYEKDLALNNPKWLICHQTKPNIFIDENFSFIIRLIFQSYIYIYIYREREREKEREREL